MEFNLKITKKLICIIQFNESYISVKNNPLTDKTFTEWLCSANHFESCSIEINEKDIINIFCV